MENLNKFQHEVHLCQKCGREIPLGAPYYSVVRNLDFFYKNPETQEEEIEIEDSQEIISLCKSCGSVFNQNSLETILKHLPIPGQETRN